MLDRVDMCDDNLVVRWMRERGSSHGRHRNTESIWIVDVLVHVDLGDILGDVLPIDWGMSDMSGGAVMHKLT